MPNPHQNWTDLGRLGVLDKGFYGIYHQSDIKFKNKINDSEWELKIKTNSIEINYQNKSVWTKSAKNVENEHHLFFNNPRDIYSHIQKDSDNNWMFKAFSRTTFYSAEYKKW